MKKYYLIIVAALLSTIASAQNWNEWFRQKKTQIRYLTEQIAALKVYGDYAWKGYATVKKGLTNIGDIKGGDMTMHGDYFASLRLVNPVVKSYYKVGQIIALQRSVLHLCQKQKKEVQTSGWLTANETRYVDKVFTRLLTGCAAILDELITVATNNGSGMKDSERIARIDTLYADMQERYSFVKSFTAETSVLLLQRQRAGKEIKTSRLLFGVH